MPIGERWHSEIGPTARGAELVPGLGRGIVGALFLGLYIACLCSMATCMMWCRCLPTGSSYGGLADFLAEQVFGRWDLVLYYDLARGLRVFAGSDGARLKDMVVRA